MIWNRYSCWRCNKSLVSFDFKPPLICPSIFSNFFFVFSYFKFFYYILVKAQVQIIRMQCQIVFHPIFWLLTFLTSEVFNLEINLDCAKKLEGPLFIRCTHSGYKNKAEFFFKILKPVKSTKNFIFHIRDHPLKTSACLRGEGVSPGADGPKVTVHKDKKSPS